jgi:hypothetical protein
VITPPEDLFVSGLVHEIEFRAYDAQRGEAQVAVRRLAGGRWFIYAVYDRDIQQVADWWAEQAKKLRERSGASA